MWSAGVAHRASRSGCEEGVAVDLEAAGVGLAASTSERVGRRADRDVDEAGLAEELMPALTGQPTGNSAGPQVDVAQRLGGDGTPVGDVGELQHTSRAQDAFDLVEHLPLVGAQVDDAVRYDDVGGAVGDG